MYIRPEADAVEVDLDSKYLMFIRPEADAVEVGLDSNDEDFAQFERGIVHRDLLGQIPEGSAEAIALCLLGM
jgi:hypothetical protein